METVWFLLKKTWTPGRNNPIMRTIKGLNDRLVTVNDQSGTIITFPTHEMALDYAVKMGLDKYVVCKNPAIIGDATSGFVIEDI